MASRSQPVEPKRPAPRLYLVTPPAADPARLAARSPPRLRLPTSRRCWCRSRAPMSGADRGGQGAGAGGPGQGRGADPADGHPEIVARAGADGAHLTGIDDFNAALATLKPERIAGCGGLATRHDAMLAAEAGADYVMFGEPDADGRPAVASTPCSSASRGGRRCSKSPASAMPQNLDEIAPLAEAGADFVAARRVRVRSMRAGRRRALRRRPRGLSLPEAAGMTRVSQAAIGLLAGAAWAARSAAAAAVPTTHAAARRSPRRRAGSATPPLQKLDAASSAERRPSGHPGRRNRQRRPSQTERRAGAGAHPAATAPDQPRAS